MAFGLGKLADPLHEGERFPEIAESKRALDAVGFIAQLPIGSCAWKRRASSRPSGGTPPRQGVQVFSARVSVMWLSPMSPTIAMAGGQRSTSPNTMSSEPMIAETSASMWPRLLEFGQRSNSHGVLPDEACVGWIPNRIQGQSVLHSGFETG